MAVATHERGAAMEGHGAMDDSNIEYVSPLVQRWSGTAMCELFGAQRKFSTWRRLWLALAEAQQELGLDVTDKQLDQIRAHLDDIDFAAAGRYENKFRHDVMAHIHTLADAAPAARPVIHLGATSQFVNCNTDMILMREGLALVAAQLANLIDALGNFAGEYRELPCLGFTHYQPAQMTTVGKRAALWCADFIADLDDVEHRRAALEFRGVKGTTGTQASYLALFGGDHEKVLALEKRVAEKMGFEKIACVTGQTYSRKVDATVVQTLAGIGASVHKMCNDIRLLANLKEIEEPFAATQVGSSAMAYKRNPMRCERATGLARFLMDISASPLHTAAEQWLERTLDDSSNKRLVIPEAFLATDAILNVMLNVSRGLVVYPGVIATRIKAELPFMATENILMAAVQAGGDRQELHERIRVHSQAAAEVVKVQGKPNDLLDRLKGDDAFAKIDIDALLDPAAFVGRSAEQVDDFLAAKVAPVRSRHADALGLDSDLNV